MPQTSPRQRQTCSSWISTPVRRCCYRMHKCAFGLRKICKNVDPGTCFANSYDRMPRVVASSRFSFRALIQMCFPPVYHIRYFRFVAMLWVSEVGARAAFVRYDPPHTGSDPRKSTSVDRRRARGPVAGQLQLRPDPGVLPAAAPDRRPSCDPSGLRPGQGSDVVDGVPGMLPLRV